MTKITKPGLYRFRPEDYHADILMDQPTLSAGVCKHLVDATPFHARYNHPRLNPSYDATSDMEMKRKTAFGSAAHEMLLGLHEGDHSLISVIDADDYRTKAAREARDAAIDSGKFPLLPHEMREAEEVVNAVRQQIDITCMFPGDAEVCAVAEVDGVWCRCLCDWLVSDGRTVIDAKFTQKQMNPTDFVKHAVGMSYDTASGHYRSVLASIEGVDVAKIDYVFLVIERGPPVVATLIDLPIENADTGIEKAAHARSIWRRCLEHDHWPSYGPSTRVLTGNAASWSVKEWEDRKMDRTIAESFNAFAPIESEIQEA